jgi:hypothetical protein
VPEFVHEHVRLPPGRVAFAVGALDLEDELAEAGEPGEGLAVPAHVRDDERVVEALALAVEVREPEADRVQWRGP